MNQGVGKIISIDAKETTQKGRRMSARKIEPGTSIIGRRKATHLEKGVELHGAHVHCHMWW